MSGTASPEVSAPTAPLRRAQFIPSEAWPYLILLIAAIALPFTGANDYWILLATRMAIYTVLIMGLNLVVGFAGQLALGYVGLLTVGAYTSSVLVERLGVGVFPALAVAAIAGGAFGALLSIPALRLRTFYFAMTTMGFATIVSQIVLAWQSITGGGNGIVGPVFPAPLDAANGFYLFCLVLAAICTWITLNLSNSRHGRALLAVRDVEVAAATNGVNKNTLFLKTFFFSGFLSGLAGALFATLQSYITPDAFTLDLSVLFFIAILIGGRGSIIGPLLATVLLTLLPEISAPLVTWAPFLYAILLLVIVLLIPGGIAALLDAERRKPLKTGRSIVPQLACLPLALDLPAGEKSITVKQVELSFGQVRALDGLNIEIRPGQIHGLIGPNGSGKTTTLNVISGFGLPQQGSLWIGDRQIPFGSPNTRVSLGIARTFQTPKVVGEATVLANVMLGGTTLGTATFMESLFGMPRHRRDEKSLRERAFLALRVVGLEELATIQAERLQHSELRFMEIARALVSRPSFLLLDEPAAGLSPAEIERLGDLVKEIGQRGTGVLIVEHHSDLVFRICDQVTVLNLGRMLTAGSPAEIKVHPEVVSAYLGV